MEFKAEERTLLLDTICAEMGEAIAGEPPLPRFDLTEERKQAYLNDPIELMGNLRP